MLQSVLYFILGFLCSGLITLMVAPAIWNRAVSLTQKRVESSVPLTLNEIQSDKDQLRAEFAMTTRRLEMSIEELREKSSLQVIEINKKRDEMAKLTEFAREKSQKANGLEKVGADLQATLEDRENALEIAIQDGQQIKAALQNTTLEHEQTRIKLEQAMAESDSRRVDIVAKEASIENLHNKIEQFSALDSENSSELKNIIRENTELKTEQRKLEIALEKQTRMVERQEINARPNSPSVQSSAGVLTELTNGNSSTAELAALREELKTLKAAKQAGSGSTGNENAILRERMNSLAAQVTAMTASKEGPQSPINQIIEDAKSSKKSAAVGGPQTLADRIRVLQDAARTTTE